MLCKFVSLTLYGPSTMMLPTTLLFSYKENGTIMERCMLNVYFSIPFESDYFTTYFVICFNIFHLSTLRVLVRMHFKAVDFDHKHQAIHSVHMKLFHNVLYMQTKQNPLLSDIYVATGNTSLPVIYCCTDSYQAVVKLPLKQGPGDILDARKQYHACRWSVLCATSSTSFD